MYGYDGIDDYNDDVPTKTTKSIFVDYDYDGSEEQDIDTDECEQDIDDNVDWESIMYGYDEIDDDNDDVPTKTTKSIFADYDDDDSEEQDIDDEEPKKKNIVSKIEKVPRGIQDEKLQNISDASTASGSWLLVWINCLVTLIKLFHKHVKIP